MFSKTQKTPEAEARPAAETGLINARPAQRNAPSILGADLQIVGNIESDGDLQIEGQLDGDVRSVSLTIGEKARIKGEINCDSVTVHGAVSGKIVAKEIMLSKTARVVGDIAHDLLAVERGAYVDGQVKRRPTQAAAQKAEAAPSPQPAQKPAARPAAGAAPAQAAKPAAGSS